MPRTTIAGEAQVIKPVAIVVCPTYENANEIFDELIALCNESPVFPGIIHGHMDYFETLEGNYRCDFLVATPGRLADYMKHGYVNLTNLRMVILDEFLTLLGAKSNMIEQLDECFFSPEPHRFNLDRREGLGVQRVLVDAASGLPLEARLNTWLRKDDDGTVLNRTVLQQKYQLKDFRDYTIVEVEPGHQLEVEAVNYIINVLKKKPAKAVIFAVSKARSARLTDYVRYGLSEAEDATWPKGSVVWMTEDVAVGQRRQTTENLRRMDQLVVSGCRLLGNAVNIPGLYHAFVVGAPADYFEFFSKTGRVGRNGNPGEAHLIFSQEELGQHSNYREVNAAIRVKGATSLKYFTMPDTVRNVRAPPLREISSYQGKAEQERIGEITHAAFLLRVRATNPEFVSSVESLQRMGGTMQEMPSELGEVGLNNKQVRKRVRRAAYKQRQRAERQRVDEAKQA